MLSEDYESLNFEEQCRIVRNSKLGETWERKASGRKVTIAGHSAHMIHFVRENGRAGRKGDHYFAYDYRPVKTNTPAPAACSAEGVVGPARPFDVGLGLVEALNLISRAVPLLCRSSCQWSEDMEGNWDTACGETFSFHDGGPRENRARWCQYCGGELVAVPFPQHTDKE